MTYAFHTTNRPVSGQARRVLPQSRPDLSVRLATFLGDQVRGPSRDKLLAQRLALPERSIRHYLSGAVWPGVVAWRLIVREFGDDVLSAVFGPEIDETRARLAAEVRALEVELDDRRTALRAVARSQEDVAPATRRAA